MTYKNNKNNRSDDMIKGAAGGLILGACCGIPVVGALGGAYVGANYDKIKKRLDNMEW